MAGHSPVLRDSLGISLAQQSGWKVLVVEGSRAVLERPGTGVVLLVAMPPAKACLELVASLATAPDARPVLVLTTIDDERFAARLLDRGARGCLDLSSTSEELLRALREVGAGRVYVGARFSADDLERRMRAQRADDDAFASLTPRERQVMQLVASGLTNDDVATRLAVSRRTVEAHRAHVMDKLRLNGAIDLLRYALKRGLVALD